MVNSSVTDWAKIFADRIRRQRLMQDIGGFQNLRPGTNTGGSNAGGKISTTISDLNNPYQSRQLYGDGTGGANYIDSSGLSGPGDNKNLSTAQRVAAEYPVADNASGTSVISAASDATGGAASNAATSATAETNAAAAAEAAAAETPGRDQLYEGVAPGLTSPYGDPAGGWYRDELAPDSENKLAQNPGLWSTRYTQSQGLGWGVKGLMDQYGLDPQTAFLLSLTSSGENTPSNKLDFVGGMYNWGLDPAQDLDSGIGGEGTMTPGNIINQIFGAGLDSPIGAMLYNENLENPEAQIGAVRDFVESALYGRVSPEVIGPYLTMLDREGALFADYKLKTPNSDNITFGQWMLDRYGPSGGL